MILCVRSVSGLDDLNKKGKKKKKEIYHNILLAGTQ
jgi:hypothetical protein